MKLIVTSFGITGKLNNTENDPSIFYSMPPINMRSSYESFAPDFVTFLLCDKLIMDEASYERLQAKHHYLYKNTADTFKLLYTEGFLELKNFEDILERNKQLLGTMLENDLSIVNYWLDALSESVDIWNRFINNSRSIFPQYPHIPSFMKAYGRRVLFHDEMYNLLMKYLLPEISPSGSILTNELDTMPAKVTSNDISAQDDIFILQALKAQIAYNELEMLKKREKSHIHPVLKETLRSYLAYINANIVISNEIGAAFHDWVDMVPFYKKKFIIVGKENSELSQNESAIHKLFELAFPEFNVTDASTLLKLLNDKRINNLRQLVQDAADNKVEFDNDFAKSILKEVIVAEQKTSRYRNIISYATLPLDFLPWVGTIAEKVVEEGIGMMVESKLKSKYRWYYLLSDVIEN